MSLNELKLYGVIGDTITGQSVKAALDAMDQTQPLYVRIDSEGGSVFDGLSIYEALAAYPGPKKAIVEPTAFSIASYIVAAFDEVEIVENGYLMIHAPYMETAGSAEQLSRQAEVLSKLEQSMVNAYASKSGKSQDEIRQIMANETFYNATEAVEMGFATRVVSTASVKTRMAPTAKHKRLPQMVFSALFGADQSGVTGEQTQEKTMSQTPIAATVQEIKAAFPKAKAEFILSCIERQMPMASVAAAAAEELMAENQELMAKVAAMEEEMAALKAKASSETVTVTETEEEEEPMMKAKSRGVKPVAKATSSGTTKPSASAQWKMLVAEQVKAGMNRFSATKSVNRSHPELRQQMLAEVNI